MTRIVIIGAGPAGLNTAQTLANKLKPSDDVEVLVLEKSQHYYYAVGAPRAFTEASFAPKMFIPYDKALPAAGVAKMVRAVATAISANPNEVSFRRVGDDDKLTSETETVTFDFLIIATGSSYTTPIKPDTSDWSRAHMERQLAEVRDQIVRAEKILIVGGGSVGCEVAGDIAAHFPTKHVTVLESRDKLVAGNDVRDKFRNYLNRSLAKLNVKVVLGEKLDERLTGNSFEHRVVRTDKGTEIESDIQLLCGGFHPIAELVQTMDASLVDERGFVKVNGLLQLDDGQYHHIFALGDVVNHKTPKLAYWAAEQAKHLANELVAVVRKKQPAVATPFPLVTTEAVILPLGPYGGVSQLPVWGGSVVGDCMTRLLKSGDMFASRSWAAYGATVPN